MLTTLSYERILQNSPAEIWPALSDTATLNRRLKLAPMKFSTINGVRHGTQKMLGLTLRWTELPWEWHWEKWLKNERVFTNGFFHKIQGYFSLTPELNGTKVELKFTLDHRFSLLAPLINSATQKLLIQIMDEIEKLIELNHLVESQQKKSSIEQWLSETHASMRGRIPPKELAYEVGQDWKETLTTVLDKHSARLSLRFDAICPHCRGAVKSVPRLTELPKKSACESCLVDFDIESQESIEVSLRDNLIPLSELNVNFCSADVVHKPTIIVQRLGGNWREELRLAEGIYRLKRKGELKTHTFVVSPEGRKVHLRIDELWPNEIIDLWHPECVIEGVDLPFDTFIMLERLDLKRGILNVSELLIENRFVELIPSEDIITSFPIEMGHRAVLFTDVVGSTEMYYRIGDQSAFRQVRESFLLVGAEVKKHNGVLVKTIGDATMYAFANAEEALRAAIDIQLAHVNSSLKLRASLHYGPCIAVGTADGQDYFGDTINICAKFQSAADADEIVFDKSFEQMVDEKFWDEISKKYRAEDISFTFKTRNFDLKRLKI